MDIDVLVIGGGHAAIEAASASARLGVATVLVTQSLEAIGRMSCNPAIGGVAKGQLVREIDALGGLMGRAADANGIHFRMLNQSRGAAVWGPRAQQDMDGYSRWMRRALQSQSGLELREDEVVSLSPRGPGWMVHLASGTALRTRKVVVTTGTFARGKLFRGEQAWDGGRIGEGPSRDLSLGFQELGHPVRRLKTGTPARLRAGSIDWSQAEAQPGDESPWPFSPLSGVVHNRVECHIIRTDASTHALLREGFARSPLFTGVIQGLGPRYCPSIEDKVARFPDRDSHQLFLEPEGLDNDRIYVNGFSSSLPEDVQDAALRSIPALASCEVIRYGYAVEYDAIQGTSLHPTLESRQREGLYFAGQTCGTSGYEEAAAQGLAAGTNAALACLGRELFLPDRASSYLGVLLDDLTSLDLTEPYRLFTSRAEYRLHLRHDNAEERLTEAGWKLGLVSQDQWDRFEYSKQERARLLSQLETTKLSPSQLRPFLSERSESVPGQSIRALEVARRPQVRLEDLLAAYPIDLPQGLDRWDVLAVESFLRYQGFFQREERDLQRVRRQSSKPFPPDVDWMSLEGVSIEAREALARHRPLTLSQAERLPGVRPADLSVLLLLLSRNPID